MKFTKGIEKFETSVPADYPYTVTDKLIQAVDRSASGIVHVESFNVQTKVLGISFTDLPRADTMLLVNFFLKTAMGRAEEFILTDDQGTRFDKVRFAVDKLSVVNTSFENFSVGFSVEVATT